MKGSTQMLILSFVLLPASLYLGYLSTQTQSMVPIFMLLVVCYTSGAAGVIGLAAKFRND